MVFVCGREGVKSTGSFLPPSQSCTTTTWRFFHFQHVFKDDHHPSHPSIPRNDHSNPCDISSKVSTSRSLQQPSPSPLISTGCIERTKSRSSPDQPISRRNHARLQASKHHIVVPCISKGKKKLVDQRPHPPTTRKAAHVYHHHHYYQVISTQSAACDAYLHTCECKRDRLQIGNGEGRGERKAGSVCLSALRR
jgi:hypothetical protein